MMKTLRRLVFALYALFAAAIPAYADVIWSPIDIAVALWPVTALLVILVVLITICIIRKFRK